MGLVIALVSHRNGTGKSATAQALAASLSIRDYKVLFIDLDAKCNSSYALNARIGGLSSLEVLTGTAGIEDAVQILKDISVVSASPSLSAAETLLSDIYIGKECILDEALAFVRDKYDYIILDTPSSFKTVTINALTACDGIIIPTIANEYSAAEIFQMSGIIQSVRTYSNSELKVYGILRTRYNPDLSLNRSISIALTRTAEELESKLYETFIRECASITKAQSERESIFKYDPGSRASSDYHNFVDEFLKYLEEEKSYG